jgi:hypothetical protein
MRVVGRVRKIRSPGLLLAGAALLAACATQEVTTAPAAAAAPVTTVPSSVAAAPTAAAPATPAPGTPTPPAPRPAAANPGAAALATAYGIEFIDTRLSAAGSVVDLRYRVLDPEKAAPLLDRKIRPVLVHVESGKRYYVPQPPIVGALRQTVRGANTPQPGRTYFMLFANPDRALKSGDTLALFVGEHRVGEFRIAQ